MCKETNMSLRKKYYQGIVKILSTPISGRITSTFIGSLDEWAMKFTGGKFSFSGWVAGLPTIGITTIGRKSGLPRTHPLLGIEVEEGVLLIASNFGRKNYPAWYYNIMANSKIELEINSKKYQGVATEVEGEIKEAYWKAIVKIFPGYAGYKKRASHREIPVLLVRYN
jgi:deazaflavin-dependent oxidoreductase (nitroreductase family)